MNFDFLKKNKRGFSPKTILKLKECLEYLETKPVVEFSMTESYDPRIDYVLGSLPADLKYSENYEKISEKPIEELNMDEIATYYTFILRGERFCYGMIAEQVNNLTLLRLLRRQLELIEK